MLSRQAAAPACMPWSSLVIAWRKTATACATAPESWGSSVFPHSYFKRATIRLRSASSDRIARLWDGAYSRFDSNSPQQLRDLLSAVAVYAAGGRAALEDFSRRRGGIVLQLPSQVRKG